MIRPNFLDQRQAFKTQFAGMTEKSFSYNVFETTREKLVAGIHAGFTDQDRQFLFRFKSGEPDWSLFPHKRLKDLPAIKWKLTNIHNLKSKNPKKHAKQLKALQDRL